MTDCQSCRSLVEADWWRWPLAACDVSISGSLELTTDSCHSSVEQRQTDRQRERLSPAWAIPRNLAIRFTKLPFFYKILKDRVLLAGRNAAWTECFGGKCKMFRRQITSRHGSLSPSLPLCSRIQENSTSSTIREKRNRSSSVCCSPSIDSSVGGEANHRRRCLFIHAPQRGRRKLSGRAISL